MELLVARDLLVALAFGLAITLTILGLKLNTPVSK